MNKPKLTQKYGGWICTGVHPSSNIQITRWAKTPEDAYKEYQKLSEEVDGMLQRAKLYKIVASRGTETEKPTYTNDFRTERAYPYYDIYDQAEEQNKNNEKILSIYIGVLGVLVIAMFVGIALS